jgi:hypothetical protein
MPALTLNPSPLWGRGTLIGIWQIFHNKETQKLNGGCDPVLLGFSPSVWLVAALPGSDDGGIGGADSLACFSRTRHCR